ncbi:Gp37-like protein [Pseudactinotalea suaedae]|uniref:Gp37-like protein n=1 Tax=Pseudactinotalea suaedae TaxID=1524924 RepID=UPI0012E2E0A0|nr:hypothetical protein [Pseudactinotalea suaedae]
MDEIDIRVYSKTFERLGWVGDPLSVTATPRHNQQPSGQLVVSEAAVSTPLLLEPGARVVIRHRDEVVLSGPCRLVSCEGRIGARKYTIQVQDDWRLLQRMLGWQVPGSGLGSQTSEYDVRTGPAETVVKQLVAANSSRLGLPVTVVPTQGRGATITVQSRMDRLNDVLFPLVDQAGIGVTVRQSGAGLRVDCYTPAVFPLNLSEAAGTVAGMSWSRRPPEMTRVVVGGPGEGTARVFRSRVSSTLETAWGDVIEGYIDARDIKADDPNRNALMDARGDAALAEAGLKYGLSVQLLETSIFRYGGTGVHVGDLVQIEPQPGAAPITDVLREATLSWSKDNAVPRWTPVVGDRSDDNDKKLATVLGRAIASLRRLQKGT